MRGPPTGARLPFPPALYFKEVELPVELLNELFITQRENFSFEITEDGMAICRVGDAIIYEAFLSDKAAAIPKKRKSYLSVISVYDVYAFLKHLYQIPSCSMPRSWCCSQISSTIGSHSLMVTRERSV